MQIGSRPPRGYSYLAVLFLVALTAAGLAALGQAWSTAAQREREQELQFRGMAIGRAILSYSLATPTGTPRWPRSLEDLVEDRRGPVVRRHLRKMYVDPFTGRPDWVLVPSKQDPGGFEAVHSSSDKALLKEMQLDGHSQGLKASDWIFAGGGVRFAQQSQPSPPVLPAHAAAH